MWCHHIGRIGHRIPVDGGRILTGQSSHHIATIGHRMPLDGGRVLTGHVVSSYT